MCFIGTQVICPGPAGWIHKTEEAKFLPVSQNHRMIEVGGDLEIIKSNFPDKARSPKAGHSGTGQWFHVRKYLKLHSLGFFLLWFKKPNSNSEKLTYHVGIFLPLLSPEIRNQILPQECCSVTSASALSCGVPPSFSGVLAQKQCLICSNSTS